MTIMEMKKILMAAVALICMTMTSVVFTSCGDDKDDNKKTVVYYKYADVESVRVVPTEEGQAQILLKQGQEHRPCDQYLPKRGIHSFPDRHTRHRLSSAGIVTY